MAGSHEISWVKFIIDLKNKYGYFARKRIPNIKSRWNQSKTFAHDVLHIARDLCNM